MISLLLLLAGTLLAVVLVVATGVTLYELVLFPRKVPIEVNIPPQSTDWTKPKR